MVVASDLNEARAAAKDVGTDQYVQYSTDKMEPPIFEVKRDGPSLDETRSRITHLSRGEVHEWDEKKIKERGLIYVHGTQFSPAQYHFIWKLNQLLLSQHLPLWLSMLPLKVQVPFKAKLHRYFQQKMLLFHFRM